MRGGVTLSILFQKSRSGRLAGSESGPAPLSSSVGNVDCDLGNVKAAASPELKTPQARALLHASVSALQNVLTGLDQILTTRSWLRWPGSGESEQLRRRYSIWLRSIQAAALASIFTVAAVDPSVTSTILAALVALAALTQLAIYSLGSDRSAKTHWAGLQNMLRSRLPWPFRWIIPQPEAPSPASPPATHAEILVDEPQLAKVLGEALDALGDPLQRIDDMVASHMKRNEVPNMEMLRLVQLLAGSLKSSELSGSSAALEAQLTNVLSASGIEVCDWHPEASSELWELRKSASAKETVVRLPAIRWSGGMLRGIVYQQG
jgi:hypothetical protein